MQTAKRVAVNTVILYARMAITVIISLYTTRLLLGALGIKDFGLFNLVGGTISMLAFLNASMTAVTQRFMSYTQGAGDTLKQKNIFSVSIFLHLIIAIIVVVILETSGLFIFKGLFKIDADRVNAARVIYHCMVFSTFFTIIAVPYDAVINAHENMLLVAVLGILEAGCKLGIAFFIAGLFNDRLVAFGFLMAILTVILMLIRIIYCHFHYEEVRFRFKKYYSRDSMKEMTGFAGWSFLGSSTSILANYGQTIVINMFFGTIINAAQGVAIQVNGQLSVFAATMMKAINPLIDKSEGAGNRQLMLRATLTGSKISFFLLMILFIPFLIETEDILNAWLNIVPTYAVLFCQLQLIRSLIEQLFIALSSSISAVGNIKRYQLTSALLTCFPLILTFFLFRVGLPVWIIFIVYIVYAVLNLLITLIYAQKVCGLSIKYFAKHILVPCVSSFFFVYIISYLPILYFSPSLYRIFIVVLLSGSTSLVTIWRIGLSKNERILILKLLQTFLSKFTRKQVNSSRYSIR